VKTNQKDFFSFHLYSINTHNNNKSDNKYIFDDLVLTQMPVSNYFVTKKDFLGLYNEWDVLHLIVM